MLYGTTPLRDADVDVSPGNILSYDDSSLEYLGRYSEHDRERKRCAQRTKKN